MFMNIFILYTWEFQYLSTQRHRYLGKTWQFLLAILGKRSAMTQLEILHRFLLREVMASLALVGGIPTPLKHISQLGSLCPIYGKINNVPSHQADNQI